jgi:hypothetical protein
MAGRGGAEVLINLYDAALDRSTDCDLKAVRANLWLLRI